MTEPQNPSRKGEESDRKKKGFYEISEKKFLCFPKKRTTFAAFYTISSHGKH